MSKDAEFRQLLEIVDRRLIGLASEGSGNPEMLTRIALFAKVRSAVHELRGHLGTAT